VEEVLLESEVIARALTEEHLKKHRVGEALRKYDLVLGVSKAVPIEMGGEWINRITPLDPGVSLDEKDLELIKHIRGKTREKRDYIVLGGRPDAVKGLAEALVVFRLLSKHFPGLKLVVTGEMPGKVALGVVRASRKLGIEGKLVFTGFITREKRFELVAGAKLMLYPSHEDSFSYAVLESLHLGTPVVGYRIPALEIYYGKCPGVELVNEWDLEGLTVKAVDVLEKGVDAVEPRIKSWEEIMSEEVGYVKMLVGNAT
jgi:Glycosyltransferase